MKKQKKNRKNVDVNQKLSQYSLFEKFQMTLLLFLIGCNPIFATTKEENLSDEFFNAAMNLPTDETTAAPLQAPDVATNAAANNSNFMQPVIDAFNKSVEGMQTFGSSISSQIEKLIGHNPFLSKLLVVLILVVVSIIVIVILALIAKKVMTNKNVVVDSVDGNEEDFEEYEEEVEQDSFDEQATISAENNVVSDSQNKVELKRAGDSNSSKILTSPTTVDDAMKMFLKITE